MKKSDTSSYSFSFLDSLWPILGGLFFIFIGASIGCFHNFRIIHGDLTTSNMIYTPDHKIYFIDFGLAGFSSEVESRGVDLLLAKRTLSSTHPIVFETCFEALIASYVKIVPSGRKVIEKID